MIRNGLFSVFLLATFSFAGCSVMNRSEEEKIEIAYFESLAGQNECFFVGNNGLVFQGIYLRKNATDNSLFSSSNQIFSNSNVSETCIVSIETAKGHEPRAVIRDSFTKSDELKGKWIAFTPKKIFFLNCDENKFGFYSRPK